MPKRRRKGAAMRIIRDDAHPLALRAREQRGCRARCGCSDCEVLDDIERALVSVGWLTQTRVTIEWAN